MRRHPWYPGETISVAIGQGPLLATPLQMAVFMAAIANGGELMTPHLIRGAEVPAPRRVPLSAEHAGARARGALGGGQRNGHRHRRQAAGLRHGGQDRTVQVIAQKTWIRSEDLPFEQRDHAWFASFAPFHAPQLVVVVFIEHGGHGGSAAAPMAREAI